MHFVAPIEVAIAVRAAQAQRASERALSGWILLAALLSFAALALPFFLGQVYVADDLGEFHLPLRNFYAEQLARHESFDWMPSLYGGFYVTAEGQLGAYHPLHVLLYRALPLGAAFDLELLASYPFMFGGMYLLLRRWLARRDASLAGALVFTFGGFNLLHFVHPNAVAIVAHIPWLLLAIEASLTEASGPRRATADLAIGLLTASQLLLGYPQYVWFSLLVETAYAVWRAISLRVGISRVVTLLLAVTLGVLTAAVQLLPTIDGLSHSTRAAADGAFANTGSLHPLNLVQFVAPYLFQTRVVGQNTHELGLYAGAVPFLLCLWLLTQRPRWGRFAPLIWATIVFGGFSLLLVFGEAGGVYWLQSLIPGANRFRFPCRAIVLVQLCVAVATAIAFAILREGARDGENAERRRGGRALVVALTISLLLAVLGPLVWPEYVATPFWIWCGPALVGVGAGLVTLAERQARGAFVALVLFTAVDLCAYGLSYSVYPHTSDLHEFVASVPLPPGPPGARVAVEDTGGLRTGNRMLLAGVQRVDGYAGLEPARELDYSKLRALRLAGTQYVLRRTPNGLEPNRQWTAISLTEPRVRMVEIPMPDVNCSQGATASSLAVFFSRIGLLGKQAVAHELNLKPQIIQDRPGHIVVACRAPRRQVLVTTESFHRGWRAVVDGRVQGVVPIDSDFLGCAVDAGSHEVEFQFRPDSLLVGEYLSAGGLVLMVALFGLRASRRAPKVG